MARVKIHSKLRHQPVTKGPTVYNKHGLRMRKPRIVPLYHPGAWSRKFFPNARKNEDVIFMFSKKALFAFGWSSI
jgi:hypothetical protein